MVGQVARVSTWQYDVDIDYIKSIGGVAKCFNPKARSGTPDIGAYRPGTVTTVTPGSCVAPPITGTGGAGGAGGSGGTGGSGGAGGRGGAGGTGGRPGAAGGGRGGHGRRGDGRRDERGRGGHGRRHGGARAEAPRAPGRPEAEESPRGRAACGAGAGHGRRAVARARSAAARARGGAPGSAGAPPAGSGGATGGSAVGPGAGGRASRQAAAARCLDRPTARERSRRSGSWRSAREPSGVGDARDLIVPALGAYRFAAVGGAFTGVSNTPFVTTAPPLPVNVAENVPVAYAPPTAPPFVIVTLQSCLVPVWTKSTETLPGVPISPPSVGPSAARVRPLEPLPYAMTANATLAPSSVAP